MDSVAEGLIHVTYPGVLGEKKKKYPMNQKWLVYTVMAKTDSYELLTNVKLVVFVRPFDLPISTT